MVGCYGEGPGGGEGAGAGDDEGFVLESAGGFLGFGELAVKDLEEDGWVGGGFRGGLGVARFYVDYLLLYFLAMSALLA